MAIGRVRHRVKTLPSGKRVRQTISPLGRIIRVVPLATTKTGRRLNKRRRRIHK